MTRNFIKLDTLNIALIFVQYGSDMISNRFTFTIRVSRQIYSGNFLGMILKLFYNLFFPADFDILGKKRL